MMRIQRQLCEYLNGNYKVRIYSDGTKIRWTKDDEFLPDFPESIDFKITDYCDMNCPMCHERSTKDGKHANLALPFLSTLKRGTELAIGGGNPLSHPRLIEFLSRMKEQGVICNITINQAHLMKDIKLAQMLIDNKLVHGVGISYIQLDEKLLEFCEKNHNAVIHLILGIHDKKTFDELADKNLKLLILGYKQFGRGADYYSQEIQNKMEEIQDILSYKTKFKVISFDNLSFSQLKIASKISKREKDAYYMGDDGQFTMYVDGVNEKFAKNSTTKLEDRKDILDDIAKMFKCLDEQA